MARETVQIGLVETDYDSDGNPTTPAAGATQTLTPLEVAPGNTARIVNDRGELDAAEFTLYFPLRVKTSDGWVATDTIIKDDYPITVRDKTCRARVQKWDSAGLGGVVVLCKAATGVS